jgi:uncharacterized protein (DUF2235 family)
VGKNILIFSDGTGQAGGFRPDETRSNVYKLYRATRVGPDTIIDPLHQVAFYDGGLGSRADGEGIRIKAWRRIYNLLAQATGLGITQNIIDCYATIIRVWQPGDRIFLFGFSRGAYTVRCVAGVLKHCGVPTVVVCERTGRAQALQRDAKSARRTAAEAVKHVYQHGSSVKGDPYKAEREARARRFRAKYQSGDTTTSNTAPYFIGVWDTVQTLGAGSVALVVLAGLYGAALAAVAAAVAEGLTYAFELPFNGGFWWLLASIGLGGPTLLYAGACMRCRGLASLARYRMAFYDTALHHAVRYARHAIAIDENRNRFDYVPWDEHRRRDKRAKVGDPVPDRIKQVWFAGCHSDVGGSYPETESRLSDIALAWMLQESRSLPTPILVDFSVLKLYPDCGGAQHDERKAFFSALPKWALQAALWFVSPKDLGWREGHRQIPDDAVLHPSVVERFRRPAVLAHGDMLPYRPLPLRRHPEVAGFYPGRATNGGAGYATTSSVTTLNPASRAAPKLVDSATSVASRPRAMSTRPIRGLLWRASKVYQRPSR